MSVIDLSPVRGFLAALMPEPMLTVSEWSDAHRRLSNVASAEPGPWRTSRTPYLREILDRMSSQDSCQEIVVMKGAQIGMALDITTPIPTPSGWSTMGALKVGDTVFDENGKPCRVTFVTETMYGHECFDVVFSDGSVIRADADHRWSVDDDKDKRRVKTAKVLTTKQIFQTFRYREIRNRYAVSVSKPLELPITDLPVPPYTLGAWLGDGNSHSNRITTHKDDAAEMMTYIMEEGVHAEIVAKHSKGNCVEIVMCKPSGVCHRGHKLDEHGALEDGTCYKCHKDRSAGRLPDAVIYPRFGDLLRKINVLKNKHIPQTYLRASIGQRLELLRGLMDTDGHATKAGHCEFVTSSKVLAEGFFELVASLGMKPVISIKHGVPMSTDGIRFYKVADAYSVQFKAVSEFQVFNLKRKRERLHGAETCRMSEITRRRIVDVIPCESVPVLCIQVDSPNHLYLAGRSMIPTHNTEAANNAVGYWIDNAPGSILMVMPTDDTVKRNSLLRIDPMIQSTPKLRDKVAEKRSRDASNTTKQKEFPGGMLIMTGANSATALRSTPVRYLVLDEVDGYPADLDGEGSPVELAKKRTATFSKKKVFILSTPTVKGTSIIEHEFEGTDQRYYHVPCPSCGAEQILRWKNLRWEKGKPNTARYQCEHCDHLIEERHKTQMLAAGRWVPTRPELSSREKYGYHLSALYSPLGWYSWKDAAKDWEKAQGHALKLKTFVNTVLGECYVEKGAAPDWEKLYNRREPYGFGRPPKEVCMITVGADVQKDRIEAQVIGWGKGRRSWVIDYRIFDGETDKPEVWQQLGAMVNETWTREDGAVLPMLVMAVDTGYNTQHAYDFCRRFDPSKVVPVKGQERQAIMLQPPKPVDVTINGQKVGNVRLWNIGVSLIKSELYGWLQLFKGDDGEPPGYIHFPELGEHYFRGLTAEKRVLVTNRKGYSAYEWRKDYDRNEPLDTFVYARAAAAVFGIDRMTDDEFARLVQLYRAPAEEKVKRREPSDFW